MASAGAVGRVMRSPGSSATSTMATSATTRPAALPAPSRSPPARSPHSIGAAADATYDWKKYSGQTIQVAFVEHTTSNAILSKIADFEALTGIKRAGADAILTYFALDTARWLRDAH